MIRFNPFELIDTLIKSNYKIPVPGNVFNTDLADDEPFMTATRDQTIPVGDLLQYMMKYIDRSTLKRMEENFQLQRDLFKVEEDNKKLRDALEFYADAENWTFNRSHTDRVMVEAEDEVKYAVVGFYTEIWEDTENIMDCPVGGKRARKALQATEGEK